MRDDMFHRTEKTLEYHGRRRAETSYVSIALRGKNLSSAVKS